MAAKNPRPAYELVWITWQDAVGGDRIHRDDVKSARLATNINLGWIEHEDDDRIVLCNGVGDTGEMEHVIIPVSDIIDRSPVARRRNRRNSNGEESDERSPG
jgi:hypothetical protein